MQGEQYFQLYEYPAAVLNGGQSHTFIAVILIVTGVLISLGGLNWLNAFFARQSWSADAMRKPFNGRLTPRLVIAVLFVGLGGAIFSHGEDSIEKRVALGHKIRAEEGRITEGRVTSSVKAIITVSTGKPFVERTAQTFRSFTVGDQSFRSGRNYRPKDLRHFDLFKPPFDNGDYVRVTDIDGRIVKIEIRK